MQRGGNSSLPPHPPIHPPEVPLCPSTVCQPSSNPPDSVYLTTTPHPHCLTFTFLFFLGSPVAASQGLHQLGFLPVKKRQKRKKERKKCFLKAKTAAWVQCGDIIIVSSDSEKDKNCFNCDNITKIIWVSYSFSSF